MPQTVDCATAYKESASSVLGALIIYFEKRAYREVDWGESLNVETMRKNLILKNAYMQYLFEQLITAIKNSASAYAEDMKP